MENNRRIPLSDIPIKEKDNFSPQEIVFMGGTVDGNPKGEEWYIPPAVYRGDIDGVDQLRQKMGFIKSVFLAGLLGVMDKAACVWLSPLYANTGAAIDPPKIMGFLDEERNQIVDIEGKSIEELNRELYEKFWDAGIDLHLRDTHVRKAVEEIGGTGELKG